MGFNLKKLLEDGVSTVGRLSDRYNPLDSDFQRNAVNSVAQKANTTFRRTPDAVARVRDSISQASDRVNPFDTDFQRDVMAPVVDKVRSFEAPRIKLPTVTVNEGIEGNVTKKNSLEDPLNALWNPFAVKERVNLAKNVVNDVIVKPFSDAATGASLIPEFVGRAAYGTGRELAGDRGGFVDEIAKRPYYAEKKFGPIQAKSANLKDILADPNSRKMIGQAASLPTFFYAGAKGLGSAGGNLASRVLNRTTSVIPEALLNTGLQQFEQGNMDDVGKNALSNIATMAAFSNLSGWIADRGRAGKPTIGMTIEDVNKKAELPGSRPDLPVERYSNKPSLGSSDTVFFSPRDQGLPEYGDIKTTAHIRGDAKLYDEVESSYDFAKKYNLFEKPDPDVKRITGLDTLQQVDDNYANGWDATGDPNDYYDAFQAVAERELKKQGFHGAHWRYEDDLSPDQFQVWDKSIIKGNTPKADDPGISKRLSELIDDEVGVMQSEIGGTSLIHGKDGTHTNMSLNPKWYRDFFAQNGKKPTKAQLREMAEGRLANGNGSQSGEYLDLMRIRDEVGGSGDDIVSHWSDDKFDNGYPEFDAYFGNKKWGDSFGGEFGKNKYDVSVRGKNILDLDNPDEKSLNFMADVIEKNFPGDPLAKKIRNGYKPTYDDFYEVWTDKTQIMPTIRDYGFDGAKYQDEYLLTKEAISPTKKYTTEELNKVYNEIASAGESQSREGFVDDDGKYIWQPKKQNLTDSLNNMESIKNRMPGEYEAARRTEAEVLYAKNKGIDPHEAPSYEDIPEELIIYKGARKPYLPGDEIDNFTTDPDVAREFAGENGVVSEFKINKDNLPVSSNFMGESELIIRDPKSVLSPTNPAKNAQPASGTQSTQLPGKLDPEQSVVRQGLKQSSGISDSSGPIIPQKADVFELLTGKKGPLLLDEGTPVAHTPKEAKDIFRKTGKTPEFDFTVRGSGKVIAPEDRKLNVREAKNIFRRTGEAPADFNNPLRSGKKPIELTENSDLLDPETVRTRVADGLKGKFEAFERGIYGDSTADVTGGSKQANAYQRMIRGGKEKFNAVIDRGLSSESGTARRLSRGIRAVFGGAGNSAERTVEVGKVRGGIDEARELANDFYKLGDGLDAASKERIHAVLDPEIAGKNIDESSLSDVEKVALKQLREASDLINDTNFAMGKISHETWLKGRGGKYITRAYEDYDLPPELSSAFPSGKGKLEVGGYKKRGEVTDWKQENAIKDPFYLASKRVQSTFQNKAITDYANWAVKQPNAISATPRTGYTQLSDSPLWGELSGKNVRHDVLEGIKGFYSDNKVLQGLYDGLNAYDRNGVRQFLKKTKTVYNPATRLGNQTANRVFALMSGLNPITFEKNMQTFAKKELSSNGKYARLLRERGILGTDMTKYELVRKLADEGNDLSKLGNLDKFISDSYGAADDKAKLAALKTWLDKGFGVEEALTKVQKGFQDYSRVGMMYDIGAKLPIVGKSFIRFQSELGRIIKNSATENPLSLATVLGSIALVGNYASQLSGETPEDKKTRESRFGVPVVPFTNIPLVMQTPFGEINVARMFGMYETAGADTKDKNLVQRVSKYLPVDVPTNKDDLLKLLGNDVLTSPVMGQVTDTDFRGKSISDPDATKYKPSTLTAGEKIANRAWNFYHGYQLPVVNDIENVGRAALGVKDQYGKERSVPQALSRLLGVKLEQFGPEQAQAQRVKDLESADWERKDNQKLINAVLKDQATGKIDQSTAQKRINQINSKAGASGSAPTQGSGYFANPGGGFSYMDGDTMRTVKTEKEAQVGAYKLEFEKSGKSYEEKDGMVYRRGEDGKPTVMTKTKFDYQLGNQQLDRYKKKDDLKGWLKTAEEQMNRLDEQLKDPSLDPLEAIKLQNEADDLLTNMEKYIDYGGFKKGSSAASKAKKKKTAGLAMLNADKTNETKMGTYKDLQGLLAGTVGSSKASGQRQIGQKVQLRKQGVKK